MSEDTPVLAQVELPEAKGDRVEFQHAHGRTWLQCDNVDAWSVLEGRHILATFVRRPGGYAEISNDEYQPVVGDWRTIVRAVI